MSFLTYTSHPVLFAASVGGVTLGVTLLLLPSKIISFGNFSFQSSPESQLQLTNGEGNCTVISDLEFPLINYSSHIGVKCKGQWIWGGDDPTIENIWVALFPKFFFVENVQYLSSVQKLTIKTDTYVLEENHIKKPYMTKFQSNSFSSSKEITVNWDYEENLYQGKTWSTAEVVFPEKLKDQKIYLFHENSKK